MTQDLFFKYVTSKVRKTCASLDCTCLSNRESNSIKVFGRLTLDGRPILTATLIESVCRIPNVTFNTISIDSDGRLYALFLIDDIDNMYDGNSD